MLNTDMVFDQIAVICEAENIVKAAVLHEARALTEASGGSFDTMGHLAQEGVSSDEITAITETLGKNEAGIDYLYPDTLPFLDALEEMEEPYATVTWGSLMTQMPKLQATSLVDRPYLITDIKKKGELAQTWKTPEGLYRAVVSAGQILTARAGVLVDDKPKSFEGLPEDWTGFLVQRKSPKQSQRGTVPERVRQVRDLATITSILQDSHK
jgi:hypothetical protein